jgi:hypothetical protein
VETVLATVARRERFRLDAVIAEPAETRVGLPARVVRLSMPDSSTLDGRFGGLTGDYRPRSVERLTGGALRLTWNFRSDPLPVLK